MTIHERTAADLASLTAQNRRLLDELAEEAKTFLLLLDRQRAGEDVQGELYGSVSHLGTHATLLGERLIDAAEQGDALEDGQ